jgi:hypothetical protein
VTRIAAGWGHHKTCSVTRIAAGWGHHKTCSIKLFSYFNILIQRRINFFRDRKKTKIAVGLFEVGPRPSPEAAHARK